MRNSGMGYTVLPAPGHVFAPPSWRPDDPARRVIELREKGLRHSQANLWRFPPGARGSRHREPVQEEVFCVVEGTLTLALGEPPEWFELGPGSIAVVEPETAILILNRSDADVVFFAYGAPAQPADYKAEVLPDPS